MVLELLDEIEHVSVVAHRPDQLLWSGRVAVDSLHPAAVDINPFW